MTEGLDLLLVLSGALVIDLTIGEPPSCCHPVVWMGGVISGWEKLGKVRSNSMQFVYGMAITMVTIILFAVPVYFLLIWLKGISIVAYIVIAAILFKLSFSVSGLRSAALKIKELLLEDRLQQTRYEMRALVSRSTGDLPGRALASAAIESVAESICDSIVAPVFYFMILGVPGAIGYRVVNTLDSRIGYRGYYEHLGKFSAILDDILNYIPARISIALILVASMMLRRNTIGSWRTALREHRRTASPNAGWTMAAVAGALNTRLEKPGSYVLCNEGGVPGTGTIDDAVRLVMVASLLWFLLCIFMGGGYVFVATRA